MPLSTARLRGFLPTLSLNRRVHYSKPTGWPERQTPSPWTIVVGRGTSQGSLWLEPSPAVHGTYPLVIVPYEQPLAWGLDGFVLEV